MLAGAAWRREEEWQRVAWQTAHLMNLSGKSLRRTVTAEQLLGKPGRVQVKDPAGDFEKLWQRALERQATAAAGGEDEGGS